MALILIINQDIQYINTYKKSMKENMTGKSLHNFDFLRIIGEGAWAQVYLGQSTKDGNRVAIKAVPKQKIKEVPKLEQLVKTQIKVLRECKNENVIRFVDTFTSEKTIFIATEFCNGGDMEEYLNNKKYLTQDEATVFLKHMLNGFKGLHEVGAMHRDFKLANVLLHNGVAKIADLGFAKQMVKGLTRTVLGTSLTMAPEVLDEKPYDNKADIWSLAVVYYQMIYGKYPYNGKSDGQILTRIKQNRPSYDGKRISQNCRDFIDRCLTPDPSRRITWAQIYDHPLIKKNQKNVGFVYGNENNNNLSENKNFYEKNKQPNKKFMYPELSKEINVDDFKFDEVNEGDIRATVNLEAKRKLAQQRKQIEDAFAAYSKTYFMKRNDIMFIFKYIAPYVFGLSDIKANHAISMFIMTKKAYMDMKQLHNCVVKKQNCFNLNKYWEKFLESKEYKQIQDQIKNDIDILCSQCLSYSFEIDICSKQIEAEKKDVQRILSKDFLLLVNDTVQEYWFLLADGLDRMKGQKKDNLLRVLQALDYYKGKQKTNIQQFDRVMLSTDMQQAEREIRSKLNSLFS